MRKMQKHILKGKDIFVGLEDSKRKWHLCVRSQGMIVDERTVASVYGTLQGYFRNKYPECRIKVMYEAGFNGFWLGDLLHADGISCIVTPPHKVCEEKCNKVKNEKHDARRLAKNLEQNDYTACWIPDEELREDRQISRTLIQVGKVQIATKNRIRKFFDFHGLNGDFKPGRWGAQEYRRVKEIRLSESLQICMDKLLEQLELTQRHKRELRRSLFRLGKKERYSRTVALMSSSPGIGKYTGIRLALEWGDIKGRFRTGRQLANFLGLTGGEYSTGEYEQRLGITKQGHGFVRRWLIECSWVAIKKDPVLLDKFNRVWGNSGDRRTAIVAVARKLAVRLWSVVVHDTDYCVGVAA